MNQHIRLFLIFASLLILLFTACERERTGCIDENTTLLPKPQLTDLIAQTPVPNTSDSPIEVEIKRKIVLVDKLVDYPLCNDYWRGTVYVSCEAQVADAELDADENPLFFKENTRMIFGDAKATITALVDEFKSA